MHILLAAHAKGLGTCWVGAYDDDEVAYVLGLPEHIRPIAIIPLGYPAVKPMSTSRLPIKKLIHIERW
jgi:nitroreductase